MNTLFAYEVKPVGAGFEARTPYRQVVYWGETEKDAIGAMLKGVADLAWKGHLHPEQPERKGSPPLQHAMNILADHLSWHLERRRERIDDCSSEPVEDSVAESQCLTELTRRNEVISGLATSIAALARIKAL